MTALKEYVVAMTDIAGRPFSSIAATLAEEPAAGDFIVAVLLEDGFGVDAWTGPTGWTRESHNAEVGASGSPTVTLWTQISPGGEGTTFTFSDSGTFSLGILFIGVWDGTLLSATPTETTWEQQDTNDSTPDLLATTNLLDDALAITVVAAQNSNDAREWGLTDVTTTSPSIRSLINVVTGSNQDRNNYGGGGAGVLGYHLHLAVFEEYTTGNFSAETFTIAYPTSVTAAMRYIPAVGSLAVIGGGTILHLPLRKYIAHDLPYDLRYLRLGDDVDA